MTTGTCGPKPLNVFASYDRASRTWKTSQGCLLALTGTSDEYSETWPTSGTMRNGACYQRKPLEPPISAKGYGWWPTPMYPTPVTPKGGGTSRSGNRRDEVPSLHGMASTGKWPTPTKWPQRPNEGNVRILRAKVLAGELDASDAAVMLNGKDVFSSQCAIPRWEKPQQCAIPRWKTPLAGDCRGAGPNQNTKSLGRQVKREEGGHLNPDWVEWLMGWPRGWSNLEPLDSVVIESWDSDPADDGSVSRITTVSKNRKSRLMCIGNGQVPQCAAAAFNGLMERIK